ncbi:MAG: hypothetical protein LC798_02560 [Chloroflexi bacterium]|nr:hypothetical protein [Chloroflexota bacterium]
MDTPTSEQHQRFERLCLLRSLYLRRGSRDATGVIMLPELDSFVRTVMGDPYWRSDAARSADSTV